MAAWSREAGVPYDIALQCLDEFLYFVSNPPPEEYKITKDAILFGMPFDAGVDLGSMDTEAFGKACLQIADCKDFDSLSPGFLDQAMASADTDGSGDIDFGEFLYFYYKFSFSEEVLVGNEERKVRMAARLHNIPYDEVGKYKYTFDRIDDDKNGYLEYDEFKVLVAKVLKVPRGEKVPEARCKEMWREASRESKIDEGVDFLNFVGWYKRYFMGDGIHDESPFEAYYHNIRRVSTYDSSLFH
jgi:Ca2+-binding EF-hand superfamily protein